MPSAHTYAALWENSQSRYLGSFTLRRISRADYHRDRKVLDLMAAFLWVIGSVPIKPIIKKSTSGQTEC